MQSVQQARTTLEAKRAQWAMVADWLRTAKRWEVEDARRLVKLLHGIRAKINLIPLNEHPASPYRRPEAQRIERFAAELARTRSPVSVRRSRGDDVYAACGQLAGLSP